MSRDAAHLLLTILRDEAGWPLPAVELDHLTFEYRRSEIQFLRSEATQISRILQLRKLGGLDKVVFIVDQGHHDLSRFAIRRVAIHFTTRPTHRDPRPYFALEQMVFLVLTSDDQVSVVHFKGQSALSATMAVLGPHAVDDSLALLEQLEWTEFCGEDWSLESSLYVRSDRSRNRNRCTREFLERECGPLVGLFEQALCAPSITQAEEDRLLWHAQRGARWAIEAIMNNQMRLVFDVAYRCCKQYDACRVPFEDVFSGGLEGLLIAIQKYEIERGHRFASFAWQWVANKAERAFVYSLRPINIPYHVWEKIGRFCRSSNADLFFAEDHSSFSFSADSRMWIEKWGWIMRVLMQSRTLTADSVELELISDENAQTELDLILDSLTVPLVLNGLNHRQTEILLMRHGLHPDALGRGMTLDQIATRLQITRERVRQIELQAINKLRKVSASLDGA